ncbi:spondin-2-like [Heptranchias perlo]|uniref:spondin-2-like n=1 Tax=Heptranchias perlo TaxID=212740 RepID=UPI003559F5C1
MNPLLLVWPFLVSQVVAGNRIACQARKPANYSLRFLAEWNILSFPKQFPTHRPPAQWSMLFGCVHNYDFTLWAEGVMASSGVRMFVEDGKHKILLEEANATMGAVQSWFHANPIMAGEGNSSTVFTVTPTHPLVSFLVRIIPSPDWFLGANSINLCENNKWKESYTLDLFPWDAGTDSGFTFSSPNFATDPQETMFQITAKHPSHPANSFFYPRLESLPRMGCSEFDLLSAVSPSQAPHQGPEQTQPNHGRRQNLTELLQVDRTLAENETKVEVELFKADDVFNDVLEKPLEKEPGKSQDKDFTSTPLDCEVSYWSSWGLCSQSCGIGARERTRFIVQHPANDGETCPPLLIQEECEESPCPTPVADGNVTISDPAEGTVTRQVEPNLNESKDSGSLEETQSLHNETGGEPENMTALAHHDATRVQETDELLKLTSKSQGHSEAGNQSINSPLALLNASTDQFFTNLTSNTASERGG